MVRIIDVLFCASLILFNIGICSFIINKDYISFAIKYIIYLFGCPSIIYLFYKVCFLVFSRNINNEDAFSIKEIEFQSKFLTISLTVTAIFIPILIEIPADQISYFILIFVILIFWWFFIGLCIMMKNDTIGWVWFILMIIPSSLCPFYTFINDNVLFPIFITIVPFIVFILVYFIYMKRINSQVILPNINYMNNATYYYVDDPPLNPSF